MSYNSSVNCIHGREIISAICKWKPASPAQIKIRWEITGQHGAWSAAGSTGNSNVTAEIRRQWKEKPGPWASVDAGWYCIVLKLNYVASRWMFPAVHFRLYNTFLHHPICISLWYPLHFMPPSFLLGLPSRVARLFFFEMRSPSHIVFGWQ